MDKSLTRELGSLWLRKHRKRFYFEIHKGNQHNYKWITCYEIEENYKCIKS